PDARILDLTHRIRPQDLRHASYYLGTAIPCFPKGTIHVAVVDPGVGTDRPAICIEIAGRFLIGPDNGIFSDAVRRLGEPPCVRTLANSRLWREPVSNTFHGRDIFAPVAAHLAAGVNPQDLGPETKTWVMLPTHSAVRWHDRCEGEVQFID